MKISVVVPSFNQAEFLDETLQSLWQQNHPELEVLVMDGGSTDGSVDILRRHERNGFSWKSGPDGGQADAINQGLFSASGDIVAYLNSDDVYCPGALASVEWFFNKHPEVPILYGNADHLWTESGKVDPYDIEDWNFDRLIDVCFVCQPAVFWRREIVEKFGVMDDTLYGAMDYDYWLRVGKEVPLHRLRGPALAGSRMHADNKTLSQRLRLHEEILRVALRHSPRPPYRWLKVLAHIKAEEETKNRPGNRRNFVTGYVSNVLELAKNFQISLNEDLFRELEKDLESL